MGLISDHQNDDHPLTCTLQIGREVTIKCAKRKIKHEKPTEILSFLIIQPSFCAKLALNSNVIITLALIKKEINVIKTEINVIITLALYYEQLR